MTSARLLPDTAIDEAVEALEAGLPVVIPTDSVYGVVVDPAWPGATDRLFEVKERPAEAALPMLAADVEQAFGLVGELPDAGRRLGEAFWPGGLTLVLPRRPGLGFDLGGLDDRTIAVRVPDHALLRQLAAKVGPLAATSANLHGRPTPETASGVLEELGQFVGLVLDGGPCAGAPSSVVSCTADGVHVLREGRVSRRDIAGALG